MNRHSIRWLWLLGCTVLAAQLFVAAKSKSSTPDSQQCNEARDQQAAAPQKSSPSNSKPAAASSGDASSPHQSGGLNEVLHAMDENAAKFRTAQADFVWQVYNSVINDIAETDRGKIYFRRSGANLQMSARFTDPPSKQVIFTGKNVQVLEPGGQVDEYDTAAHQEELETFLVLGFGSSGKELQKSFELQDLGEEKIDNTPTRKLQLIPKAEDVKRHVPKIVLWIQANGLSKQQQIYLEGGDYRLAKYSTIQLNQNLSENLFKLKANVKKTVRH
jgi:outer membrane lipoprotein-sorting protein